MSWICFQIMIKMSAFSSLFMGLFVCIFMAFLSGRVKRVQLPRVGGPCLRWFVWLKEYVSCVNYLLLLVRGFWLLNLGPQCLYSWQYWSLVHCIGPQGRSLALTSYFCFIGLVLNPSFGFFSQSYLILFISFCPFVFTFLQELSPFTSSHGISDL